jgi:hypothetical protein
VSMSGYAGALPHVVLSRTLWLLVASPLLGLFLHAVVLGRGARQAGGGRPSQDTLALARIVGVWSVALAAAVALTHVAVLSRHRHHATVLLEYVARGARIGSLDAPIALAFDALSAFACTLACIISLAAAAFVAWRPPSDGGWRELAWIELALSGALLAFLADGLVAMSFGWALSAAAIGWLAGGSDPKVGVLVATRSAFAMAALLLGGSLLFWGLGGTWRGDDYVGEPRSAVVALRAGTFDEAPRRDAPETSGGSLTLTSMPGTAVFFDDGRAPVMTAPFVGAPLPPGPHTLRLALGAESNDVRAPEIEVRAGDSWAIVPFGPTLSFREMGTLSLARDRLGEAALTRELRGRPGPAGLDLLSSVLVLWTAAAWAMGGAFPQGGAPRLRVAVAYGFTTAMLGPFFLARTSFLLAMAPRAGIVVASAGAAILVRAGYGLCGRGPRHRREGGGAAPLRWAPFLAAAPGGLAWAALGMFGEGASIRWASGVVVCAGVTASGALLLVARRGWLPSKSGDPEPPKWPTLAAVLLDRVPSRLGTLLLSYERWVIDATGRAGLGLLGVLAWAAALSDTYVVIGPADAAAARIVRFSRRLSPLFGGSPARAAWAALAFFATVAAGLTMWLRW